MTPETAPASPQAQREAPGHGSSPDPPQASHGQRSAKREAADAWGMLMGEADRLVEEQLEREARLKLIHGSAIDVLATLPDESVHCCVTSPPYYGLRDYGVEGQIGLEQNTDEYVAKLVAVFREVRRVLRSDGTSWVNLGDSYATGAGKACSPGGGKQGENFSGPRGYRGGHEDSPKRAQVPDGKNPNACVPTFQPNRMPLPGLKPKDLIGIPWRVAFALQADGWWLRQDLIWHKPNPMPESVKDRCTKAHEYVFLLAKSERYRYDADAIREPASEGMDLGLLRGRNAGGPDSETVAWHAESIRKRQDAGIDSRFAGNGFRNKRSVWTLATLPTPEAHFATFPIELPELCILAGCPEGGIVLDPFAGAGTTGLAALKNGRDFLGIELNAEYIEIARARARKYYPLLMEAAG